MVAAQVIGNDATIAVAGGSGNFELNAMLPVIAYNLIRTVMAEAAERGKLRPRELSFKGALQTLTAYRPLVEQAPPRELPALYESMLDAIASHVVGNRPYRYEPRAIKRRPKEHDRLTIPRQEAKRRLAA